MDLKSVDFITREELEAQVDDQSDLNIADFVLGAEVKEEVMERVDLQSADLVTSMEMEALKRGWRQRVMICGRRSSMCSINEVVSSSPQNIFLPIQVCSILGLYPRA